MVASADVYRGPDPEDRRRVLVFISDKGAATLAKVERIGKDAQQQLNATLGDEGSAELEEVLSLLLSSAKSDAIARGEERTMTARPSPSSP
jgi:DNA-binding MarR family transcriptional regulator